MAKIKLSLSQGFILQKGNLVVAWDEKNPLQTFEGTEEDLIETSLENLLILFGKFYTLRNHTDFADELEYLKRKYHLTINPTS